MLTSLVHFGSVAAGEGVKYIVLYFFSFLYSFIYLLSQVVPQTESRNEQFVSVPFCPICLQSALIHAILVVIVVIYVCICTASYGDIRDGLYTMYVPGDLIFCRQKL